MNDHAGNALDTYPEGHPRHCSLCGQRAALGLAAENEQMRETIATLREALRPFAESALAEVEGPHKRAADALAKTALDGGKENE